MAISLLDQHNRDEELSTMLSSFDPKTVLMVCQDYKLKDIVRVKELCGDIEPPVASNKELQLELVKMHINDQYARTIVLTELLEKYDLIQNEVITDINGLSIDEDNVDRLKEIIVEYGFPTMEMVGKDAMDGVFLIIQHADKEWQVQMLDDVKIAFEKGDFSKKEYAYLYDRVQVRNGKPQKYGTQLGPVNKEAGVFDLFEVQNLDSLDYFRMELGLLPISIYKELTDAFYSGKIGM
jgi:hypothetical protein